MSDWMIVCYVNIGLDFWLLNGIIFQTTTSKEFWVNTVNDRTLGPPPLNRKNKICMKSFWGVRCCSEHPNWLGELSGSRFYTLS